MMLCSEFNTHIQTWLRDYDNIQSFAVVLIYIQIVCALIGSLGALYNGVSLINVGIGLFALVAIESNSQSLGRTYAVLLFSAILLDMLWFILFCLEIWYISSEIYGEFVIFSVRLSLLMQVIGFTVRSSSSLLWIQMYRLGPSLVDCTVPRDADLDSRSSFMSPITPPRVFRPTNGSVGAINDPGFYSSPLSDNQDDGSLPSGHDHQIGIDGSLSDPLLKPPTSKSLRPKREKRIVTRLVSL
ncbi:hypothetical protein QVD17_15014 [Tagetes erecta]|uniref:Transmembrane protein n=1 Tax=Tagetes erecta TaxID=13708 RepID=A0AAD8KP15_TARER|nr:hypothetical protein QVD17_15014 [Tagetes erecta]